MLRVILFATLLFFLSAFVQQPKTKEVTFKTYKLENSNEWGYDVFVNKKLYVHQPHIPAIAAVKGFKTQKDAEKVAKLMADKVRKNIMPPSVSVTELDSLKIVR